MAELLSMTLLSPEPVSAAKPQAGLSNDGSAEPDQSFAATLAAEVNGKAPEKSAKSVAKTRQNNASEVSDLHKSSENQSAGTADTKSEAAGSAVTHSPSEAKDDKALTAAETEAELVSTEKGEAEQSHWLNLLEKAKTLHERLTKAEKTEPDTKVVVGPKVDKVWPGMTGDPAEIKAAGKQVADPTTTAQGAEALAATEHEGAVVLKNMPLASQGSEQHLTAEELKALKLSSPSDKNLSVKNDSVDTPLKQGSVAQLAQKTPQDGQQSLSETVTEEAADQALVKIPKDTSPDQNKVSAQIEKSLKRAVDTGKTESAVAATTERTAEVTAVVGINKAAVQPEQLTLPKGVTLTVTQSEEQESETENLSSHASATDPKASIQAQSAAAVLAPVAKQSKAAPAEAKVTTEEVLKQVQTATLSAQGEQGASSSSGESGQQSKADSLLSVIEQQKSSNPVATEINTFSSQLKSSLEKASAALTVTARDLVSEQSQKPLDPLGQKLNLIQPEASNQLKEKMLMMVKDKVHTAEIRLDPSELGSMQIKISLQQDQMSVQFMVQQGNAKELMEQQMPKLKELLQQQGIELSQGSVQQQNQSSSGQGGGRRTAGGHAVGTAADGSEQGNDPALMPKKNPDRVVDYYA
ncbi:flagellar hook-length control protein FliK [Rheinheimera sp. 1928-s]|uniref:flagellar hook-length control protein FliK n=1 Tax=Rheinheimera sp. 1928-s TaxID=3033803 RepID=UPI00262285B6|nr:flagellar hook-length control protein FliK [Rheinheimera sp. 1928-s]MDF3125798.1 flagellar hook-length control protein FliK [Rheinheimera sp. 1928-s]